MVELAAELGVGFYDIGDSFCGVKTGDLDNVFP